MKTINLLLAATALAGCVTTDAEARRRTTAPSIRIADANASEENTFISFVVTRSSNDGTSSVRYRTIDGSAIAGRDYVAANGIVTFAPGDTSETIAIRLIRSGDEEPTERFSIRLRDPVNGRIADSSAIGTITDDADPDPEDPPVETDEPPPAEPEPTTKICTDGSVIPIADTCPTTPTTPRDPLLGQIDIASDFDYNLALQPTSVVGSSGDAVGAFRFICGAGKLGYIDPIVNPGGVAPHLHQFYGNESITKDSTYATLRAAGSSTCNQDAAGNYSANRSGYWMPAMFDGRGNVVKPDYVSIYYKARPLTDPIVSNPAHAQYRGQGVKMPNGLKFIFGFDMVTGLPSTGGLWYNCQGTGAVSGKYANLAQVVGKCPAGAQLGAVIEAPECWDGKNLDSANHRDHMAYASYGSWGYLKCPTSHPYLIPTFTLAAWYTVQSGDSLSLWSLSSDAMHPSLPKGTTFHADFFMAWDPTIHEMWWAGCINLKLNCSAGQLGNGRQLKGAAQPLYNGVLMWKHPSPRVPVPGS